MRFRVMDVRRGFCAYLHDSNDELTVFDCGSEGPVTPTEHFRDELGKNKIRCLVVTSYDEDHLSDFPSLRECINIFALRRNVSVTADKLREMKADDSGRVTLATMLLLRMMEGGSKPFTSATSATSAASTAGSEYELMSCWHGPDEFSDMNNMSLVTFLVCLGKVFLVPGDLEWEGWERHLRNPLFCSGLTQVDVFIASHNGREKGYHERVFEFCRPEAVVLSDSGVEHGEEEDMASVYGKHVKPDVGKVYTTRDDGWIEWSRDGGGRWTVRTERGASHQP